MSDSLDCDAGTLHQRSCCCNNWADFRWGFCICRTRDRHIPSSTAKKDDAGSIPPSPVNSVKKPAEQDVVATEKNALHSLQEQARSKPEKKFTLGLTNLCSALADSTDCVLDVYTPGQHFENKSFVVDWTNFKISLLTRQKT